MKKLKFISLKVISTSKNEAKVINFNDWITVFTSEKAPGDSDNHTGKSLIAKSIYYALGADIAKNTTTWKDLKIATIIEFLYNDKHYVLFRKNNRFVLDIKTDKEVRYFPEIRYLKDFYNELFDIKLRLLSKNDEMKHLPYPQALFLPFYIDQDKGWSTNWESFASLSWYKNYLKEIFEFYTGAKTNDYYKLIQEEDSIKAKNISLKEEYDKYQLVINENIKSLENSASVNADYDTFKKEIDTLLLELNKVQNVKIKLKKQLVKLNIEKSDIQEALNNYKTILLDLEKDEKYIFQNCNSDEIKCPICGTNHKNDGSVKLLFSVDIENCKKEIQELNLKFDKVLKDISDLEHDIDLKISDESRINKLLNKNKKKVTLKDVLVSEGINKVVSALQKKQRICKSQMDKNTQDIKEIGKELKHYKDIQKERNEKFQEIMKKYIIKLEITDINPQKIGEKNSAGGSDTPKGMLAYTLSYYKMICENKDALVMPLVLDTLVQQDPSPKNILQMFNLILEVFPKDCQLILATTNLYNLDFKSEPYRFLDKNHVLSKCDYEKVKDEYNHYLDLIEMFTIGI